jgi:hypothetical protein
MFTVVNMPGVGDFQYDGWEYRRSELGFTAHVAPDEVNGGWAVWLTGNGLDEYGEDEIENLEDALGRAVEVLGQFVADAEEGRFIPDMIPGGFEEDDWAYRVARFADPYGDSALHPATEWDPRSHPCPTCGEPDRLTGRDVQRGYQCDSCAARAEGTYFGSDY